MGSPVPLSQELHLCPFTTRLWLPAPCPGGDACPAAGAPAEAEPGKVGDAAHGEVVALPSWLTLCCWLPTVQAGDVRRAAASEGAQGLWAQCQAGQEAAGPWPTAGKTGTLQSVPHRPAGPQSSSESCKSCSSSSGPWASSHSSRGTSPASTSGPPSSKWLTSPLLLLPSSSSSSALC